MMRLLAAGVGLGALSRIGAQTAQAANGDPVLAGQTVDATVPTRVRNNVTSYSPDTTADGVQGYATGTNNSGLFGRNNSTDGVGVSGAAPSGTGVFGESSNGFGVGGKSDSGRGVYGVSSSGVGVWGTSTGNYGVVGTSTNSHGVFGQTGAATGAGAVGWYTGSSGYGLYGLAPTEGTTAYAGFFNGRVGVQGDFTVFSPGVKSAAVPHPDGSHRRLYCVEAPESYFEDVGRGQLANGRGQVQLDPDFGAVVRTDNYEVFLTPRGDCRGLYVASQTASGFEVRELQSGTSTLAFSYRIMAHRKDIAAPRLERVTIPQRPTLTFPGGPDVPSSTDTPPTVVPATATSAPAVAVPTPSATPQPTATQLATPTPTPGPASSPIP